MRERVQTSLTSRRDRTPVRPHRVRHERRMAGPRAASLPKRKKARSWTQHLYVSNLGLPVGVCTRSERHGVKPRPCPLSQDPRDRRHPSLAPSYRSRAPTARGKTRRALSSPWRRRHWRARRWKSGSRRVSPRTRSSGHSRSTRGPATSQVVSTSRQATARRLVFL